MDFATLSDLLFFRHIHRVILVVNNVSSNFTSHGQDRVFILANLWILSIENVAIMESLTVSSAVNIKNGSLKNSKRF